MITLYFVGRKAIQRLREGPLGPHMDGYAELLHEQGYSRGRARRKLQLVAKLSRWLASKRLVLGDLNQKTVDDFNRYRRRRHLPKFRDPRTFQVFFDQLCRQGVIHPPAPKSANKPLVRLKRAFEEYLFQERGLQPLTVKRYLRFAHSCLSELFAGGPVRLRTLRPSDITQYVSRHAYDGAPSSAKWLTAMLRSFFRFLWLKGQINTDLAACVPTVASWRLAGLPRFLEPKQVERVLMCCDRKKPVGRRDYAILLLLARLGLRGGEILTLTLEDIDWEAGEILVRGKGSRQEKLPLPCDVGRALAAYLKSGRPACSSRHVFIRARAPYREFARSASVSTVVRYAVTRASIDSFHQGAHVFRHSLARRMLNKGASLGDIGEILRHQHQDTTAIYAKVDLPSLQGLAQPWPGGVS